LFLWCVVCVAGQGACKLGSCPPPPPQRCDRLGGRTRELEQQLAATQEEARRNAMLANAVPPHSPLAPHFAGWGRCVWAGARFSSVP
jgi:hypothetical protein